MSKDKSSKTKFTAKFSINNILYQVSTSDISPEVSLNTFLRNYVQLPGTKWMCLEGVCGACVVNVSKVHPFTKTKITLALNSCLTPIFACDGLHITTIEGLGNSVKGYSPLQQRLIQFNASQCGYCTPGFIMNMHSLMVARKDSITMEYIENSFDGNICRCTGYRPILDAFKSLTVNCITECPQANIDIEDYPKGCLSYDKYCGSLFNLKASQAANGMKKTWYKVFQTKEIFEIFDKEKNKKYILVAGNTSHVVDKRDLDIQVFIDINDVKELHCFNIEKERVILGGNISLSDATSVLLEASMNSQFKYCEKLATHIKMIGNSTIRNVATIAGNLMIKHMKRNFTSDIFTIFGAVGAKLEICNQFDEFTCISINEFLQINMKDKIIYSITLLPLNDIDFMSFKIMPRAQNAQSYLSAAFLVQTKNSIVTTANFYFSAINLKCEHATQTENFLKGQSITNKSVVESTLKLLSTEITHNGYHSNYQRILALSLLYKFFLNIIPTDNIKVEIRNGANNLTRPLSSGKQSFITYKEKWPLTQPIPKVEGILQASGEAQYTNDLPTQKNELWAAFVIATEVHSEIIEIDSTKSLNYPGTFAFFSAKDIPNKNNFTPMDIGEMAFIIEEEEIFCSKNVKFYGQPVGVILADTFDTANKAAGLVEIKYKKNNKMITPTIAEKYAKGFIGSTLHQHFTNDNKRNSLY